MSPEQTVYVLGVGAIGLPLAAFLKKAGRAVVAVHTSRNDVPETPFRFTVDYDKSRLSTEITTISLARIVALDGVIVIAAKSYANKEIARQLRAKHAAGPIVLMQNGVGIEKPFLNEHFSSIFRSVLYVTSETESEQVVRFHSITSSAIGVVEGRRSDLCSCVKALTTEEFPFRSETNIQREIWKKAIVNTVFNSVCPLLEVNNGIFARDSDAAQLASEIVEECLKVTERLNIELTADEVIRQIILISSGSKQLISTLQDIRSGRQTEIEWLNLEIVRIASAMEPPLFLPRVEMLGKMISIKSLLHNTASQGTADP
ncbi:MAG: ketopantoate reductase family protein [Verrucomicrobia bacterium]|nr:ketopantoate reductase family protein [Verrucomicrobiota bacterium]